MLTHHLTRSAHSFRGGGFVWQNRLFVFTAICGVGLTATAYVWKGLDTGAR